MTRPVTPALLTVDEAGAYLAVGRSMLYALVRSGQLRTVSLGRKCRRIRRTDLDRFIEQRTETHPTEGDAA